MQSKENIVLLRYEKLQEKKIINEINKQIR